MSYDFSVNNLTGGTINGSSSNPSIPGTSTTAAIIWACNTEPGSENVHCHVMWTDGTLNYDVSGDLSVTLKGIPSTVEVIGATSIQKCCLSNKTYTVSGGGDADTYHWAWPPTWSPVGSTTSSTIILTPDVTFGGAVTCTTQVSTSPSSCYRTPSVTVSRYDPVITGGIAVSGEPCIGTTVTFTAPMPCGFSSFSWSFPQGWINPVMDHNHVTVYLDNGAKPGDVELTINFTGGCTAYTSMFQNVISAIPDDPEFDNDCPLDYNNCYPGPNRICANGGTINVLPVAYGNTGDVQTYNVSVSSPWQLVYGYTTASSFNAIPYYDINNVEIILPNYTTTNSSVWGGTYSVQAVNCIGLSHWANYTFHREVQWWCDCSKYVPCVCPPANMHSCDEERIELTDENNFNPTSNLFPNPNNGNFHLNLNEGEKEIVISDIAGRIILEKNTSDKETTFSLNNISSGIYIVSIKTVNGIEKIKLNIQ